MAWQQLNLQDAKINMSKVVPFDSTLSTLDKKQAYYHNNRLTALHKYTTDSAVGYKCYKRQANENHLIDGELTDYIEINKVTEGGSLVHMLDIADSYYSCEKSDVTVSTFTSDFYYGVKVNGVYVGTDVAYWTSLTIKQLNGSNFFLVDDPNLNYFQILQFTGSISYTNPASNYTLTGISFTKSDTLIYYKIDYANKPWIGITSKANITLGINALNKYFKDRGNTSEGAKWKELRSFFGNDIYDLRWDEIQLNLNTNTISSIDRNVQFNKTQISSSQIAYVLNISLSINFNFYSSYYSGGYRIIENDLKWNFSKGLYGVSASSLVQVSGDNYSIPCPGDSSEESWDVVSVTDISCHYGKDCGDNTFSLSISDSNYGIISAPNFNFYSTVSGKNIDTYSAYSTSDVTRTTIQDGLIIKENDSKKINKDFVLNYVHKQPVTIGSKYKVIVRLDTQGTQLVNYTSDGHVYVSQNGNIYDICIKKMFPDKAYGDEVNVIGNYCKASGGYKIFNTTTYYNAIYDDDSSKVICSCDDWNGRFYQESEAVAGGSVSFSETLTDMASDQFFLVSGVATNYYKVSDLSNYLKMLTSGTYTITSSNNQTSTATVTNGQGVVKATSRVGHFWNSTRSYSDIPCKVISDEQNDFDLISNTGIVFKWVNSDYKIHKDTTAYVYYSTSYISDTKYQQYRITENGFTKDYSEQQIYSHNSTYQLVPSILFTAFLPSDVLNIIQIGSETYSLLNYAYALTTPALVYQEDAISINIDPTAREIVIQGAFYQISGASSARRIMNPYDTSSSTYCCDVTGLRYLGYDSTQAYFYSPATGVIYTFNGANKLNAFIEVDKRIPLATGVIGAEKVGIDVTNIPSMNIVAMAFTDGVLIICNGQSIFIDQQTPEVMEANKEYGLIRIDGSYYYFGTNNTITGLIEDAKDVVVDFNLKTSRIGLNRLTNQTCSKHRVVIFADSLNSTTKAEVTVTLTGVLGNKTFSETLKKIVTAKELLNNEYQWEFNPKNTKSNYFQTEISMKNADLIEYWMDINEQTEENLTRY